MGHLVQPYIGLDDGKLIGKAHEVFLVVEAVAEYPSGALDHVQDLRGLLHEHRHAYLRQRIEEEVRIHLRAEHVHLR